MLKICVAGKNNVASDALSYLYDNYNEYDLIALPNQNDSGTDTWQKSLLATANKLNINICNSIESLYQIKDLLFISLEFDKIIKVDRFESSRLYNIHFSMLPEYKGMYTSALPILHGKKNSGVTLHVIDRGIDTGNIIDQMSFPIESEDTCRNLFLKYNEFAFELFQKNITNLIDQSYNETIQPFENASYYSKDAIDFSTISIDLNKTAYEIRNQIRAYSFREYQLPEVMGERICNASITKNKSTVAPGKLLNKKKHRMLVSTIDYDIILHIDSNNN